MNELDVVLRLEKAISARDIDDLLRCFADDYDSVLPLHPARDFRGVDGVRANWEGMFARFPVMDARISDSVVDGAKVWAEWEISGTQADGATELFRGVSIFRVVDDRLAAVRFYLDPVDAAPGAR